MQIARSTKTTVFLEIKDFNFKNKTVFQKWCSRSNRTFAVEGRYAYNKDDIAYEIKRCEAGIDSGEFIYNAKNKRYLDTLYKELKRLNKAA